MVYKCGIVNSNDTRIDKIAFVTWNKTGTKIFSKTFYYRNEEGIHVFVFYAEERLRTSPCPTFLGKAKIVILFY